jgi:hypothetical protein
MFDVGDAGAPVEERALLVEPVAPQRQRVPALSDLVFAQAVVIVRVELHCELRVRQRAGERSSELAQPRRERDAVVRPRRQFVENRAVVAEERQPREPVDEAQQRRSLVIRQARRRNPASGIIARTEPNSRLGVERPGRASVRFGHIRGEQQIRGDSRLCQAECDADRRRWRPVGLRRWKHAESWLHQYRAHTVDM